MVYKLYEWCTSYMKLYGCVFRIECCSIGLRNSHKHKKKVLKVKIVVTAFLLSLFCLRDRFCYMSALPFG